MDISPAKQKATPVQTYLPPFVSAVSSTLCTYPFEYLKTTSQLQSFLTTKEFIVPHDSVKPLFAGCAPLAAGMALKGCARVGIFTTFERWMKEGKTGNASEAIVAALMTGALETVVIIPFENLKTRLIESSMIQAGWKTSLDQSVDNLTKPAHGRSEKPKHGNFKNVSKPSGTSTPLISHPLIKSRLEALKYYSSHPSLTTPSMIREIYTTTGVLGFFRAPYLTIFRQLLNSTVWYTSYSFTQQLLDPTRTGEFTQLEIFGLGFASSLAVVATTQPLDTVKTRMQSKDGQIIYRNALNCAKIIWDKEGASALWSGAIPRGVKICISSTAMLTTYDWTGKMLGVEEEPLNP
ncbi:Mrx20 protein [Martiniozyma asiatica (nom. inval.)]|nr:Mrx20 protein [Martiniozyma asiatica]